MSPILFAVLSLGMPLTALGLHDLQKSLERRSRSGTPTISTPTRTRPVSDRLQPGGVQATGNCLMPWMNDDASRAGLLACNDVGHPAAQFLESDADLAAG